MKTTTTPLEGLLVIEPDVYPDNRGHFLELFQRERYKDIGIDVDFHQDNLSFSHPSVLRGLHFQQPNPQDKLIQCIQGRIYDVAVDLRPLSATFGQWFAVSLDSESRRQLFIPKGFAHGFLVESNEGAIVQYKVSGRYDPKSEFTLAWDDPAVGIDWPTRDVIVSPKDGVGKRLAELVPQLNS